MLALCIALFAAGGCAVLQPRPAYPAVPEKADLYRMANYQIDVNAYNAAAEGSFAPSNCSGRATPGPAAKLVFCSVANGTAGSPLAGSVVVQVQDSSGNLVGTAVNAITISSSPTGVTGTLTTNAVSGVATFSSLNFGAADTYTLTAAALGLTSGTSSPIVIVNAGTASPLLSNMDLAKYLRNKIANNYMGDVDYVYGEYVNALYTGQGFESFIGDSTALGLSTASTLAVVARTKTILSALSSAATGVSLSFNKNFFAQQTFQALAIAMQARRDQARQTIISNLQLSVTDYPLAAVRRDLISYYFAGTLPNALQEIQQEATTASKNATSLTTSSNNASTVCPSAPAAGAGSPAKLVFCSVANGTAGISLTGSVVVQVQDSSGNLVGTAVNAITISSSPTGVTGTLTTNAVSGVATFSSLIFGTANTYILTASASGLNSGTSTPITIVAAGTPPPPSNPPTPKIRSLENLH